jgi:hypothetical protein
MPSNDPTTVPKSGAAQLRRWVFVGASVVLAIGFFVLVGGAVSSGEGQARAGLTLMVIGLVALIAGAFMPAQRAASDGERATTQKSKKHKKKAETQEANAKLIERQVLVVRCKYCQKLTPADLSECENCGGLQ